VSPARANAAIGLALLALACGDGPGGSEAERERARGRAVVGGEVVSTIDGNPISRRDVESAARAARVRPSVALHNLQDEALLALAAEREGYGDDRGASRAERQAAVQMLLLREVEARVPESAVDEAQVLAAFEADPQRYDRPEMRGSVHVWAEIQPGASSDAEEQLIRQLHAELSASSDPEAEIYAIRRRTFDVPFAVRVDDETLLAASDESADPAYLRAIFAMAGPGLVPAPVRSSFGWHAVLVTQIQPGQHLDREETIDRLRAEWLASERARRMEALVAEIAQGTPVVVDPPSAHALLSDPRLWDDSP
jgi:hypothetical protein